MKILKAMLISSILSILLTPIITMNTLAIEYPLDWITLVDIYIPEKIYPRAFYDIAIDRNGFLWLTVGNNIVVLNPDGSFRKAYRLPFESTEMNIVVRETVYQDTLYITGFRVSYPSIYGLLIAVDTANDIKWVKAYSTPNALLLVFGDIDSDNHGNLYAVGSEYMLVNNRLQYRGVTAKLDSSGNVVKAHEVSISGYNTTSIYVERYKDQFFAILAGIKGSKVVGAILNITDDNPSSILISSKAPNISIDIESLCIDPPYMYVTGIVANLTDKKLWGYLAVLNIENVSIEKLYILSKHVLPLKAELYNNYLIITGVRIEYIPELKDYVGTAIAILMVDLKKELVREWTISITNTINYVILNSDIANDSIYIVGGLNISKNKMVPFAMKFLVNAIPMTMNWIKSPGNGMDIVIDYNYTKLIAMPSELNITIEWNSPNITIKDISIDVSPTTLSWSKTTPSNVYEAIYSIEIPMTISTTTTTVKYTTTMYRTKTLTHTTTFTSTEYVVSTKYRTMTSISTQYITTAKTKTVTSYTTTTICMTEIHSYTYTQTRIEKIITPEILGGLVVVAAIASLSALILTAKKSVG